MSAPPIGVTDAVTPSPRPAFGSAGSVRRAGAPRLELELLDPQVARELGNVAVVDAALAMPA